jgi:hypothetical protein
MKYLLIILFSLFSTISYAEEPELEITPFKDVLNESYLCTGDMATGFHYNKSSKRWEQTNFDTRKYLVNKSAVHGNAWEVKEVGESNAIYVSQHDFSFDGKLYCDSLTGTWGEFKMDRNNLRFLRIYSLGYYNGNPKDIDSEEVGDNPFIEIGKCSPL